MNPDEQFDKNLEVPKKDIDDHVVSTIKAVSGVIPDYLGTIGVIGGGIIPEVLNSILPSSIENRTRQWMVNVAEVLKQVKKKQIEFEETLSQNKEFISQWNDEFISLLGQASDIGMKTPQEEKREQLKNALVHSIDSPYKYDRKKALISLIDQLSPSHVKVLKLIFDHRKNKNIAFVNNYSAVFQRLIANDSFDPKNPDPDFETFMLILNDLRDRRLLQISDEMEDDQQNVRMQVGRAVEYSDNDNDLPFFYVTAYGMDFLKFIGDDPN